MCPLVVDQGGISRDPEPDWIEQDKKDPNSPYHKTTYTGIRYFETIKIRNAYKNILRPLGYPVRYAFDVDYFSGIAIWVPDGWRIAKGITYERHRDQPELMWRVVGLELKEWTYNQWTEHIKEFMESIPLAGGWLSSIFQAESTYFMGAYDIWENALFKHTANDIVIYHNWDKILTELKSYGK